ncbi:hypothetical protein WVI01_08050 [Weissella viridescens]|nr:hypothetical protein WVI01_08050 [Weissella viridescens]
MKAFKFYNRCIMNKEKEPLLDQDIEKRLRNENTDKPRVTKERNKGRYLQATIAILLAIVVLVGIIYPLFNMH